MSCPIAGYRIDENCARVLAGEVLAMVVAFLLAPDFVRPWLWGIVMFDFAMRAFSMPAWSPLGRLGSAWLRLAGIAPRWVDAGPKRFAAKLGLALSLIVLGFESLGASMAVVAVATLLSGCAFLEAVFGICLGCHLWSLWLGVRDRLSVARLVGHS